MHTVVVIPPPQIIPEPLHPNVQKRVEVLKELQSQFDGIEAKFREEEAALEAKCRKLYEELYTKRYEIVNGVVEVEGVGDASQGQDQEKGVPNFWLLAMKANDLLAEEISERDEKVLKYVKDIKWCKIDEPKGFKLEFFFDSNPFIKNSVLTKIYHVIEFDVGEPVIKKTTGTKIEWYPGQCLTREIMKKRPYSKSILKINSFESFSTSSTHPRFLMKRMLTRIHSTIRDKIIRRAVSWFMAADEDDYEYLFNGDDSEDVDEDGEDE